MRKEMDVDVVSIVEGQNGRRDYGPPDVLRQLGESLIVRQLQNIWLTDARVVIIGYRRVRAAKLVGLKTLRATVTDEKLSASDIRLIQLTEDMHRADWTLAERAKACVELMKLNPSWQAKDLAAHLKLDPSSVTRLLSISRVIPAVQEAFEGGAVGLTDLYAIARADSEQEQHEMLAAKLNGASRDELERVIRRKRTGTPSEKLGRLSVPLPSGYTVTVAGSSVGYDEFIEAMAAAGKEARRGQSSGVTERTWSKSMSERAKGAKS